MNNDKSESIKLKLVKAHECLNEVVDYHISSKLWNTSANRLYYACFHAVTALLINIDVVTKTHSGTRQMFGLHYISNGMLGKEYGALYSDLFEMRQSADYEDAIDYEEHDIVPLIPLVKEFIAAVDAMVYNK